MEEKKMLCERCRGFFPVSDIKYMPKGLNSKVALCSKCRALASVVDSKGKVKPAKSSEKKTFFCVKCRYKFTVNLDNFTRLKCPFCGTSDKIIEHNSGSSDDLVKDTSVKFVNEEEEDDKPGFKLLKIRSKSRK